MSVGHMRMEAFAAAITAVMILGSCAANAPHPPPGEVESSIEAPGHGLQPESGAFSAFPAGEPAGDHHTAGIADSSSVDYDNLFLEIHAGLAAELATLEKSGKAGTKLAEVQSIVETAEEFYLEGRPMTAIKLLTEAETLLRQSP